MKNVLCWIASIVGGVLLSFFLYALALWAQFDAETWVDF